MHPAGRPGGSGRSEKPLGRHCQTPGEPRHPGRDDRPNRRPAGECGSAPGSPGAVGFLRGPRRDGTGRKPVRERGDRPCRSRPGGGTQFGQPDGEARRLPGRSGGHRDPGLFGSSGRVEPARPERNGRLQPRPGHEPRGMPACHGTRGGTGPGICGRRHGAVCRGRNGNRQHDRSCRVGGSPAEHAPGRGSRPRCRAGQRGSGTEESSRTESVGGQPPGPSPACWPLWAGWKSPPCAEPFWPRQPAENLSSSTG